MFVKRSALKIVWFKYKQQRKKLSLSIRWNHHLWKYQFCRYMAAAKHLQKRLLQYPHNITNLFVKWTEYVAKFDDFSTLNLHGANLDYFRYYSLDVISFILSIGFTAVVTVLFLIYYSLKYFLRLVKTKKDWKIAESLFMHWYKKKVLKSNLLFGWYLSCIRVSPNIYAFLKSLVTLQVCRISCFS